MRQAIAKYLVVLLVVCSAGVVHAQDAVINELMSRNKSTCVDEDGEYSDWIELYNPHPTQAILTGFYLTDDPTNLTKWQFPSFHLNPGDYILVFASGKDRTSGPHFHTNFNISGEGDEILLVNTTGQIVSSLGGIALGCDVSYGRIPDVTGPKTVIYSGATPWETNDGSVGLNELNFSVPTGVYPTEIQLDIQSQEVGHEVRYTLDGTAPTQTSMLYSGTIAIQADGSQNELSAIPTNPDDTPENWKWKAPKSGIPKARVVRAQSFYNGVATGPVYTQTYFIGQHWLGKYELPIVCLSGNSDDLFSYDNGIYVPGITYDTASIWAGNYDLRGEENERLVHFEFIEPDGNVGFESDAGLRIHGASSRSMPMKSMRLYSCRSFDAAGAFEYDFFGNSDVTSFDRLVLGSSGFDFISTHLANSIGDFVCATQAFDQAWERPVVVFLNGEYWGIHYLRERIDEDFLAAHHNIDDDGIDLIEFEGAQLHPDSSYYQVKNGTAAKFEELIDFVTNNDLSSSANYDHVQTLIDIENFRDYHIYKIYLSLFDWPGNNVRMWRSDELDGKWRWMMFDNDDAFLKEEFNSIWHATKADGPDWPNPPWSTLLLRKMLENPQFKSDFIARTVNLLQNELSESNVLAEIASARAEIEPAMQEHIDRWQYPASLELWNDSIAMFETFAKERPCYIYKHLIQTLDAENLRIDCDYLPDGDWLFIQPNPNDGQFVVSLPQLSEGEWTVSIFDYWGRTAYQKQIVGFGEDWWEYIDLAGMSNGVYILNVSNASQSANKKFVVVGN